MKAFTFNRCTMKKLLGIGFIIGTLFLVTGCGSRTEISSQKLQQGAEILAQAKQAADSEDWVLSESKLREVLALFPEEGYENERISALKVLVSVLRKQEKYDDAIDAMGMQRELLLAQKDELGAANVLNEMGVLRAEQKMYEKAMEMYDQCYAELESIGHDNAIAIKNNMADIKRLQGKYDEALALLAEIKPLAEQKNMTEIQGFIALTEGEIFEDQGKTDEAKADFEAAKAFFEEANSGAMLLAKEKLEGVSSAEPVPDCFANATWESGACVCEDGYGISLNGQSCIRIPDNAHYVQSPTDVWLCDAGFQEVGDQCFPTKELK